MWHKPTSGGRCSMLCSCGPETHLLANCQHLIKTPQDEASLLPSFLTAKTKVSKYQRERKKGKKVEGRKKEGRKEGKKEREERKRSISPCGPGMLIGVTWNKYENTELNKLQQASSLQDFSGTLLYFNPSVASGSRLRPFKWPTTPSMDWPRREAPLCLPPPSSPLFAFLLPWPCLSSFICSVESGTHGPLST